MTIRKKGASAARGRGKKGGKGGRAGSLPPREPQRITLDEAVSLTQRYRKAAPASEHAGFFWGDGLKAILEQPGCVGIRIYHGLNAEGCYSPVIVGVDEKGNDITAIAKPRRAAGAAAAGAGDAVLLDNHYPCPPFCPTGSPLL